MEVNTVKMKYYRPNRFNPIQEKLLKDQSVSIIVDNFHGVAWQEQTKVFPCFTVYKNPADFPDKYVVRLFDANKPMRLITVSDTLEAARNTIPPGYLCTPRSQTDDPIIVETWM